MSTKLTPIQASLKRNEGYVYKNLLDKRKKRHQTFKQTTLLEQQVQRELFQNEIQLIGLIYCIKLMKLLLIQYQVIKSIIYQKDITNPYGRKKTELTMKQKKDVTKIKYYLVQIKHSLTV